MSTNSADDLNVLDLLVTEEADSRRQYEKKLAAAQKASNELSRWDYCFFDLAYWLQTLAKHEDCEKTKCEIGDHCHSIAELIESDNSLPGVEQFRELRAICLHRLQVGSPKKMTNLSGVVVVLELIDKAIRKNHSELNESIDKIHQIVASHPYAPFDAQEFIQDDMRQNPKLKDFQSILNGRLTRNNVLRRAQAEVDPFVLVDELTEFARMIDAHGIASLTVREQANTTRQMLVEAHNWLDGEKISTELGDFAKIATRIQRRAKDTEPVPENVSHSIRLFAIKLSRLFCKAEPEQPTRLERSRAELEDNIERLNRDYLFRLMDGPRIDHLCVTTAWISEMCPNDTDRVCRVIKELERSTIEKDKDWLSEIEQIQLLFEQIQKLETAGESGEPQTVKPKKPTADDLMKSELAATVTNNVASADGLAGHVDASNAKKGGRPPFAAPADAGKCQLIIDECKADKGLDRLTNSKLGEWALDSNHDLPELITESLNLSSDYEKIGNRIKKAANSPKQ